MEVVLKVEFFFSNGKKKQNSVNFLAFYFSTLSLLPPPTGSFFL